MPFGQQKISMSSTHSVQTSESYCISSLLWSNFIYTYFPPLHSFWGWLKVIIWVALKKWFSQFNFLSNKLEFANPFFQTKCTCLLFSFQLGTHTGQSNVTFFIQSWIHSFSVSISVFSMYTALTEHSVRLWLVTHNTPISFCRPCQIPLHCPKTPTLSVCAESRH